MNRAESLALGKQLADNWWVKSKSRILAKQRIESMKRGGIFGKTLNTELTRNEYQLAQLFYSELVEWYVSKYDYRLSELYGDQKSDSAGQR